MDPIAFELTMLLLIGIGIKYWLPLLLIAFVTVFVPVAIIDTRIAKWKTQPKPS